MEDIEKFRIDAFYAEKRYNRAKYWSKYTMNGRFITAVPIDPTDPTNPKHSRYNMGVTPPIERTPEEHQAILDRFNSR